MSIDDALARLTAGLARDEAIARAADEQSPEWTDGYEGEAWAYGNSDSMDVHMLTHIERQSPDRVLNRYIPAIRKVLAVCDAIDAEALAGAWREGKYGDWADDIREALAGIYEPTDTEGGTPA
jgi:hypothetical protein